MTLPINDPIQASWALDRPEHESLWGDIVDTYKPIASANRMTGNPWYSTECCAVLNKNYAETVQDMVIRMNRSFAGGITKLVYHVYPYRDAASSPWPGYHNFGNAGFANAWGPRNPMWVDAPSFNDFIARNQQVLTQGQARADVAVYMQNYLFPQYPNEPHIRHWPDTKLEKAGYTHDYLNPTLLDLPNATVTNGRLAEDGPAYKAFVFDAQQWPARDTVKTALPISVAQKLLRYARAGLPVVFVGTPPNQNARQHARLRPRPCARSSRSCWRRRTSARSTTSPTCRRRCASSASSRPPRPATPSQALTVPPYRPGDEDRLLLPLQPGRRRAGRRADEPVRPGDRLRARPHLHVRGQRRAVPARRVDRQGRPRSPTTRDDGDRITVRIRLATDASTIVAISADPSRFASGAAAPSVHVTSTEADGAVAPNGDTLAVRASRAGSYATTLSDGTTVRNELAAAAGPIDPDRRRLAPLGTGLAARQPVRDRRRDRAGDGQAAGRGRPRRPPAVDADPGAERRPPAPVSTRRP